LLSRKSAVSAAAGALALRLLRFSTADYSNSKEGSSCATDLLPKRSSK
jgi:hypothetical protein